MDPINPWIDLSETRRMAERLMTPSREPVQAPDDSGFDDSFVGFSEPSADAGFADAGVEVPLASPQPADPAPPETEPANHREFTAARNALRERFRPLAMCMVDQSGDLVFSEGGFVAFHFVLRDLAVTSAPPNQNRRLKVGASAVLEILPIESERGFEWLGVVLSGALSQEETAQIRTLWMTAR